LAGLKPSHFTLLTVRFMDTLARLDPVDDIASLDGKNEPVALAGFSPA
jgi:hypothetical protein